MVSAFSIALSRADPRRWAKAGADAKATAFFYKEEELGIIRFDVGFRRSSKCYLCQTAIATTDAVRAAYAYHCKRPHSYLHLGCVPTLEKAFLQRALVKLDAISLPSDQADAATRVARVHADILSTLRH